MVDYLIVGGGIVGLATALALTERAPGAPILLLEKEERWAQHQTGNNSGVVHSGIYYKPGSLKAQLCKAGSHSITAFCREHGLPLEQCGKLIVATEPEELPGLEALHQRGIENGLNVCRLLPEAAAEIEPNVCCIAALHVPVTAITDYRAIAEKFAEIAARRGAELRTGTQALDFERHETSVVVKTNRGDFETRMLINCAGLQSDRIAHSAGESPPAKIVPFRGDYYTIGGESARLVKGLIYPVPNPEFPFLGVHLTRMIDGSIHAGPNAVLSLKREGYGKLDFSLRDALETLTYGGFQRLARKHAREGFNELRRALSKRLFLQALQRLVPDIREEDLAPGHAGIRAQAIAPDGALVDDFLIVRGKTGMHVCNAPSPGATSSLEIGKYVAGVASDE